MVVRNTPIVVKDCKDISPLQKVGASAVLASLFALLASPVTFKLVDKVFGGKSLIVLNSGKPTNIGILVHSLVFGLVILLLSRPWKKNQAMCKTATA
jgi:hypothetical protein